MMPGHVKSENRLSAGPARLAKAGGRCAARPYDYDLALKGGLIRPVPGERTLAVLGSGPDPRVYPAEDRGLAAKSGTAAPSQNGCRWHRSTLGSDHSKRLLQDAPVIDSGGATR